jgi:uncharacterized protein YhdP
MSSFASKLIAASHRPERWARRLLRWLLTALALLWLLLLALWLLLHFVILPSSDRWRPDLEAAASRALGVSVRIARLEVRTRGWMPTLEASGLELIDAQGHKALQLQRVTATLSARSFLAWPPRLEQLAVHGPELTVRRDLRGQIWVAGLALQPDAVSGDPRLLDWLLRQRELALEDGRLLWIDEMKGAAPLPLSAVRGVWRNGLRRHEGRIDVTPPPELGERLSLRARFTQPLFERPSDWRRWSGLAYAELPGARLEALHERLALPFELRQGNGALRLWAELERGHVREVQIDLGIEQARLRLTPQVDPLELQALQARLVWQRLNEGSRWALRGLRFALPADEPGAVSSWPLSNATLTLRHAAVAAPWQLPAEGLMGGELQADRLDLALLARLAGALPLEPRLRQLLGEREPQGRLEQLQARWQGPLSAPTQWRLSGQATDLALLPGALPEATPELPHPLAQPGLAGAALRFEADQDGGEAHLRLGKGERSGEGGGELRWPGLLEADRLALRAADLPLRWRRDGEGGGEATGWRVEWSGSQLESADAVLRADGHWRSGGRPGGFIDLTVRAPQAELLAVPRHLPQVLPLAVRQYLGDALQGGQLRDIRMELKGALGDFPFRQGPGRFAVSARVQDGRYAYLPSHGADATRAAHQSPWPGFEALQGEIRFDNAGMRLRIERGRSAGLDISGVEVRIPDLGQAPRVLVKGRWAGDAAQALAFVRATPDPRLDPAGLRPGASARAGGHRRRAAAQHPDRPRQRGHRAGHGAAAGPGPGLAPARRPAHLHAAARQRLVQRAGPAAARSAGALPGRRAARRRWHAARGRHALHRGQRPGQQRGPARRGARVAGARSAGATPVPDRPTTGCAWPSRARSPSWSCAARCRAWSRTGRRRWPRRGARRCRCCCACSRSRAAARSGA